MKLVSRFRHAVWVVLAVALASAALLDAASAGQSRLESLTDVSGPFPRIVVFRGAERIKDRSYEQWSKDVEPFSGIIGKAENEIHVGTSLSLDFFNRYKQDHPERMVLVHYLFRARNRDDAELDFSAADWIHFAGTRTTAALAADPSATQIQVADISRLPRERTGADIDLMPMQASGKPDWTRAETVRVVSMDENARTLVVQRAMYGTRAQAFPAGSYIASRVLLETDPEGDDSDAYGGALDDGTKKRRGRGGDQEGQGPRRGRGRAQQQQPQASAGPPAELVPVRRQRNRGQNQDADPATGDGTDAPAKTGPRVVAPMWLYNFSSVAPKDAKGLTGAEVHASTLGAKFHPGGRLARFDGIAFDNIFATVRPSIVAKGVDIDGDGKADDEDFIDSTYSAGCYRFAELLRQSIGPDRLLVGDGWSPINVRAFGVFNGMESEGWPRGPKDTQQLDWSGGINRHLFWLANAYGGVPLNYFVYKYHAKGKRADVGSATQRLWEAGGLFVDAALAASKAAKAEEEDNATYGTFEEMSGGEGGHAGWLGRPLGPAVRMALATPDVLPKDHGRLAPSLFKSPNGSAAFASDGDGIRVSSRSGKSLVFRIENVSARGGDVTVGATLRARPEADRPAGEGRTVTVRFLDPASGRVLNDSYHWINQKPFAAAYSSRAIPTPTVTVEFEIQGRADMWIDDLSTHLSPDAIYRVFEHGVVFGNPSPTPVAFDAGRVASGKRLTPLKTKWTQMPEARSAAVDASGRASLGRDAEFYTTD